MRTVSPRRDNLTGQVPGWPIAWCLASSDRDDSFRRDRKLLLACRGGFQAGRANRFGREQWSGWRQREPSRRRRVVVIHDILAAALSGASAVILTASCKPNCLLLSAGFDRCHTVRAVSNVPLPCLVTACGQSRQGDRQARCGSPPPHLIARTRTAPDSHQGRMMVQTCTTLHFWPRNRANEGR